MERLAITLVMFGLLLGTTTAGVAQLRPASGPVSLGNGAKIDIVEVDGDCAEEELSTALNQKSHWFEKWVVIEYLAEVSGDAMWGTVTIGMTLTSDGQLKEFTAKPDVSSGTTKKLRATVESIDLSERVGSKACTFSAEVTAGVAPTASEGNSTLMEAVKEGGEEPSGTTDTMLGSLGASTDGSSSSGTNDSDDSELEVTVELDSPRHYCTGGSLFQRSVEHVGPELRRCARESLDDLEGTTRTVYRASKQTTDAPDDSHDVTRESGPAKLESCVTDVLDELSYSKSLKNDSCAVDFRITFTGE